MNFSPAKGKAKMEPQEKQDTTTGNGGSKTPIPASGKPDTAAESKPSQRSTSIAAGSTKPLSIREALSLMQTLCADLRALKCAVGIFRAGTILYIGIELPSGTGRADFLDGHITINDVPVLE